jgi:hypothetical protein
MDGITAFFDLNTLAAPQILNSYQVDLIMCGLLYVSVNAISEVNSINSILQIQHLT